jgi:hypothetical protein
MLVASLAGRARVHGAAVQKEEQFLNESPQHPGADSCDFARTWMPVVKSQVPATTTAQGQRPLLASCDRAEGPANPPDASLDGVQGARSRAS